MTIWHHQALKPRCLWLPLSSVQQQQMNVLSNPTEDTGTIPRRTHHWLSLITCSGRTGGQVLKRFRRTTPTLTHCSQSDFQWDSACRTSHALESTRVNSGVGKNEKTQLTEESECGSVPLFTSLGASAEPTLGVTVTTVSST